MGMKEITEAISKAGNEHMTREFEVRKNSLDFMSQKDKEPTLEDYNRLSKDIEKGTDRESEMQK